MTRPVSMLQFILLYFTVWLSSSITLVHADDGVVTPTPITQGNVEWAVRQWLENREVALADYGHINDWDTSQVTDMNSLFNTYTVPEAAAFNDDISQWDTSRVTNMAFMFNGARAFNQNIALWNTSLVTDFEFMFGGCVSFNAPISNWQVSKVTNMGFTFVGAQIFNQPLDSWDVSNVEFFNGMFFGAQVFDQPLCNWNTSQATTIASMFFGAYAFNQDISCWDVSDVSQFGLSFMSATSFNQDISSWDVQQALDMKRMFYGATSFNQDLSGWDVSSVLTTEYAFQNATSFGHVLCWNLPIKANVEDMFCGSSGKFNSTCSNVMTIYMSQLSCNDGSNINPFIRTPSPTITGQPSSSTIPSMVPSTSFQPTKTPQPSPAPSRSPRPSASPAPSSAPSFTPTNAPSVSMQPSISVKPSMSPSVSVQPSVTPSISLEPSTGPSSSPSVSSMPTETPFTGVIEIKSSFQVYSLGYDTTNALQPGSIMRSQIEQAYTSTARKVVTPDTGSSSSLFATSNNKRQLHANSNHRREQQYGHRNLVISFVDASIDDMVDTACVLGLGQLSSTCQNIDASFRVSLEDEFQIQTKEKITSGMDQAIEDGALQSELSLIMPYAPISILGNLDASSSLSESPSTSPSAIPFDPFTGRVTIETEFLTYTDALVTAAQFESGSTWRDAFETAFEQVASVAVTVAFQRQQQRQLFRLHQKKEKEEGEGSTFAEHPSWQQRRHLSVSFVNSNIDMITDTTCPDDIDEVTSTTTGKNCQNVFASFEAQLNNENQDLATNTLKASIEYFINDGFLDKKLRDVADSPPIFVLENMEITKYQGQRSIFSPFMISNTASLRAVELGNSDWFTQLQEAYDMTAMLVVQDFPSSRKKRQRRRALPWLQQAQKEEDDEAPAARHLTVDFVDSEIFSLDAVCPESVVSSNVYCQNVYANFRVLIKDEFLHEIESPMTESIATYIGQGVLQSLLDQINATNPINILEGEEFTDTLSPIAAPTPSPTILTNRSSDDGGWGWGIGQILGVGFATAAGLMLLFGGSLYMYQWRIFSRDQQQPEEIQFETNSNYQDFPNDSQNNNDGGGGGGDLSSSREIFQDEPGNWESESMRKAFEDPELSRALRDLKEEPSNEEGSRGEDPLESYEILVADARKEEGSDEEKEEEDGSDSDSDSEDDTDDDSEENDDSAQDGEDAIEQETSTSNAGWTTGDDESSHDSDSDESEDESFEEPVEYLKNSLELMNIGSESKEPEIFDDEKNDEETDRSSNTRQDPNNGGGQVYYASNIDGSLYSV